VTYFKRISSRPAVVLATLGAAILIAGCGSSSSSSTIGVGDDHASDLDVARDGVGENTRERSALERADRDATERPGADEARDERPDRRHRP
jgi:hypothetical protein